MAEKHPYIQGPGSLVPIISHFRSSFPLSVNAETLQKLGFAPKNESYVLNILRFLHLIDEDGNKTETASKVFNLHEDDAFAKEFSKLVETSYHSLFEVHGDKAWTLGLDALIAFFRVADQTTAIVGKRQAITFQLLAALSGYGEVPTVKARTTKALSLPQKKKEILDKQVGTKKELGAGQVDPQDKGKRNFGLTVGIEINLPADGEQATYERIFKSIKENLLNE